MRATEVLQKCLRGGALGLMHALRSRVLLRAVEAMIHGSRLTLIQKRGQVHLPPQAARITNSLAFTTGRTARNSRCISTNP